MESHQREDFCVRDPLLRELHARMHEEWELKQKVTWPLIGKCTGSNLPRMLSHDLRQ